jgi:hypothetical protein
VLNIKTLKKIAPLISLRGICKDTGIHFDMLYKKMIRGAPDLTKEESDKLEKAILERCKADEKNIHQIYKELNYKPKRGKK